MNISYDSNSSNSSEDIYDYMLMDYVEESRSMKVMEEVLLSDIATIAQEDESSRKKHRRAVIPRDRKGANDRLIMDYFSSQPIYNEHMFRRRFRMRRRVFMRIVSVLSANYRHFQQNPNAPGRLGASSMQKCTAAIRMLAYGTAADQADEYLKLGVTTVRDSLSHFVEGIISQFSSEYLRRPTTEDINRLLRDGERRGFPGLMGSIDCMHWEWKNCPRAWKVMYQGRSRTATIILEAVASRDLWIWHAFFGTPGSNNDINVLQRSPVFDDVLNGQAPKVTYTVNGNTYHTGYYLTDGIYPKWAAFIDAITAPQTPKQKLFTKFQESARKDVERAFGVLQARWAIIRHPALAWSVDLLWKIMMACIIMHNMIVEDERDEYLHYTDPREYAQELLENDVDSSTTVPESFVVTPGMYAERNLHNFMARREELHDKQIHMSLKNDLVEHIWTKFQGSNID